MKALALGFSLLHTRRAWDDKAAHAAALTLLTAASWAGEMRFFSSVATPGRPLVRRPGMISATRLRGEVGEALQNADVLSVNLGSARDVTPGYRRVKWDREDVSAPMALTHGDRPAMDEGGELWVTDVIAYADSVAAAAGVVVMMSDRDEVTSECSGGLVGRKGGVAHPSPDQLERMHGRNRRHLGTRFMRFPRWGTLVSHEHVAQLGGIEAIATAVEPAVVRPLAGGVYFQLTATVATALSDEAAAKQQAFTAFAAPLLPPPVVPRS